MTDEDATKATDFAPKIARLVLGMLQNFTDPATAFTAMSLVTGTLLAMIEIEDGYTADDVLADWNKAMRAQYDNSLEAVKNLNNPQ